MSYGIRILNSNNHEILNSEETPFRFVTIAEPFEAVNQWQRNHWYRKDVTGRISSSAMIYVEAPVPVTNFWGVTARDVFYYISVEGGRTYLYLTLRGISTFLDVPSQMPVFYIVDMIKPSQAETGYGINVWDGAGVPVINSSTPLAQVEDVVQSTTVASGSSGVAYFGSSSNRICIIENVAGGVSQTKYDYPGGSTPSFEWYSIDVSSEYGVLKVTTCFWDEEVGQSPIGSPWILPVRCILLKKPSTPFGW